MKYDFDTIRQREGTSCYKYDMRSEVFGREDVIPMWIADMDFIVAPFIADAIKNRAEHGVYGYDFRGKPFFSSMCDWVRRRNGWEIEEDWMVFVPGVVTGLVVSQLAFSGEGDGVVIQPPVYPPFANTVKENGRKLINNPLKFDGERYVVDFEDLDKKLADAAMMILCNPHNPTGRVLTRDELIRIGELCVKHDVVIISDEIHSDIIYQPNRHIHIASLSDEIADRTVTFMAPSKTFNIAGLSSSVAVISNPELREKFETQVQRLHVGGGNSFGNVAFRAAYEYGEEWLGQLLEYMNVNAVYVEEYLNKHIPSVKTFVPEGTYLLWLDFREWGMSGSELREFLIHKAGLGLNDGREFGKEGAGFARMNIATSKATVEKALRNLLDACREHLPEVL